MLNKRKQLWFLYTRQGFQYLVGIDQFGQHLRAAPQALLGTVQEVLVEGPDKKGRRYMGRTRGNRIVHFDGSERLIGQLVPVRITQVTVSVLYGELQLAGV